jgi:hypothetical protein
MFGNENKTNEIKTDRVKVETATTRETVKETTKEKNKYDDSYMAKPDFLNDIEIIATINSNPYSQKFCEETKKFIIDTKSFQVRTEYENIKNGRLSDKTLKVNLEKTENELDKMLDNTYKFSGVKEFSQKNGDFINYAYSAAKMEKVDNTTDIANIFEINKSGVIKVIKVIPKIRDKKEIGSILAFKIDFGDRKFKTVEMSVNGVKSNELKHLDKKVVEVKKVKVSKMGNNTFYSTTEIPKVLN